MSSCGSVPSSLPVKPDPEGQEEQDDLLMSYLNADCLATDNSHWPPLKALDPPSPPFSTSSSDNSLPGCNSPSDTNTEEAAMNSLLYLQALHGQPVDYTQWLAVAAASAPLHPSSVSPQPPALAPELFTKLPQHFVPPIYLHQQQPHPESNVLSTTPDTATASSSSSYSSSSDSEQPKKKRGRKKKEAPPFKQRSGSVVAAPSAIAPAPLRPLAPIRPAVVAQPSSAAPSSDINVIKTENNDLPVKQESAEEAQKAAAIAKRQERLIKNRAAALLSRKRKREHLTALEEEKQRLSTENAQLKNRMATLEAQVQTLEKENQELRRRLGAKQDSSPPSKNHLATTSKNTKATGVVFMVMCSGPSTANDDTKCLCSTDHIILICALFLAGKNNQPSHRGRVPETIVTDGIKVREREFLDCSGRTAEMVTNIALLRLSITDHRCTTQLDTVKQASAWIIKLSEQR